MWPRIGRGVKKTPPPPLRLQVGAVVEARLAPDRGPPLPAGKEPKPRRCVVIKMPPLGKDYPVWVAGVTSDNDDYDPNDHINFPPDIYIQMPSAPGRHPVTTFDSICAAKVSWTDFFYRDDLKVTTGTIPDNVMKTLSKALAEFDRAQIENEAKKAEMETSEKGHGSTEGGPDPAKDQVI